MIDDDALEAYLNDQSLWQDGQFDKYEAETARRFISVAEDGSHFLDYLRAAGPGEFDAGEAGMFEFLQRHRDVIVQGLNSPDARTRRKLTWLANYHNGFVAKLRSQYDMTDASGAFANEIGIAPALLFSGLVVGGSWTKVATRLEELAGPK